METLGNQLFIEGENKDIFIYFHLEKFRTVSASKVLDNYIEIYKDADFNRINISFCNKGVPGEHLSTFRKTRNMAIGKILKGIRCIDAYFHFKENQKVISKPKKLN
jgi:hypothetical protein